MALDFYRLNDVCREQLLFQLDDNDFDCLENVIKKYKQKTGLYLDPYKDTTIHQDQVKLIITFIEEDLILLNKKEILRNKRLRSILDKFGQANEGLQTVGD